MTKFDTVVITAPIKAQLEAAAADWGAIADLVDSVIVGGDAATR